ncbi:MAG: hypothetical protein CM15mP103_08720 [Gammaproteobacteria bacterium]|nr:MAG: hypothetical protein CM15mP103_08720 [Gammaproteobacteria bacterium]
MSFQFGTNWPGFMERTGNIAGPLFGLRSTHAFFLEASFLGIMLFGKQRVSNRTPFDLYFWWPLAPRCRPSGSWRSTRGCIRPRAMRSATGVLCRSWSAIIFNPSFPYRFTHMMLASLLTSASWWQVSVPIESREGGWPRDQNGPEVGIYTAALVIPLQILAGDYTA